MKTTNIRKKRKAFTLVEVLVSVLILSVVGVALLQMNVKNQKISEYIDKKMQVAQISSILGHHHTKDYAKLDKSIYDFIKNDYQIDDIEIKKKLDLYTIHYEERQITTIEFGENNQSEDDLQTQSIKIMQAIGRKQNKTASIYFLELN